MSEPLTEIIRIQLQDDAESAAVTKDAWTGLIKAMGGAVPVTSGMSLNLKERVFMGTMGWKSLEVCRHGWTWLSITKGLPVPGKNIGSFASQHRIDQASRPGRVFFHFNQG